MSTLVSKLKQISSFFFSGSFLVWLLFGWCFFYVISAIWMDEIFAYFIMNLQGSMAFKIPYVIFLVSGAGVIGRSVFYRLTSGAGVDFYLRTLIFAGLLIYLGGFLLSISTRQAGTKFLSEGGIVQPPWSAEPYRVARIDLGISEKFLDIDLDSGAGIFSYEPKLYLTDGKGSDVTIRAFPASSAGGSYYHILNFGIAPRVVIWDGDHVIFEAYVPLKIIMPRSTDNFTVPVLPFRFQVGMAPARIIEKGRVKATEYQPFSSHYSIKVYDGEKIIAEAQDAQKVQIGRWSAEFRDPIACVQLEAVHDQWYGLLVIGLIMVSSGIVLVCIRFCISVLKGRSQLSGTME